MEGFSFKDEHILDLLKRSMINPTLKILLFCYEEKNIEDYEKYFSGSKNNNITYICLENARLSIEQLNQILSLIHT